jgi:hypothetical protein
MPWDSLYFGLKTSTASVLQSFILHLAKVGTQIFFYSANCKYSTLGPQIRKLPICGRSAKLRIFSARNFRVCDSYLQFAHLATWHHRCSPAMCLPVPGGFFFRGMFCTIYVTTVNDGTDIVYY